MKNQKIESLIDRYLSGNCTSEEKELIEAWLENRAKKNTWTWNDQNQKEQVRTKMMGEINRQAQDIPFEKRRSSTSSFRILAAAVVLIALSFGTWFLLDQPQENPTLSANTLPNTHAASLQLENGEIIYLDNHEDGIISILDDVSIQKTAKGQISYKILNPHGERNHDKKVGNNTLFIPRGQHYQVHLPDGTTVWLNSETSLKYPIRFEGDERRVKLTGEAYFDVAKNTSKPFIVESDGMDILVTGTEFNVNAYKEASLQSTTLIEGAVEVYSKGIKNITLKPGQQAYQKTGSKEIEKREVNVDQIISWRKGYFSFDHQTLDEIMNEVSRWYDIDYEIIGNPKKTEKLGGTFSREKSLDDLLNYLELLIDVKINKEERRVTIKY